MKSDAFLPFMSAYWATTPGVADELLLKFSTIYHDKIFFSARSGVVEYLCKEIAIEAGLTVAEVREAFRSIYDIPNIVTPDHISRACIEAVPENTWGSDGSIKRGLIGPVRRTVAAKLNVPVSRTYSGEKTDGEVGHGWRKELASTAMCATGGAEAWAMVREHLDCSYLCFSEAESFAANQRAMHDLSAVDRERVSQIEMIVPRVKNLSWGAVFELRNNRNLQSFRKWLQGPMNNHSGENFIDGVWSAFSDVIPSTKKEVMKGFATNIPLPIPVNPFSVAAAVNDVRQARNFGKKHGTAIFFYDLWNSVK